MADIKIYGVLVNDTTEGIVTRSNQVLDSELGKTQDKINKEILEVIEELKDPMTAYDDYVSENSDNAVKSKGIFKFVDDATSHMPYVGPDGYVYVWDLARGMYVRSDTNLTGPKGENGETGGTVHLIFDSPFIKVNNLNQMTPSGPFRIRCVYQYGTAGLEDYKDGCVKWWFNGIEDENTPDGWIGWSESNDETYGELKGVVDKDGNEIRSGVDMSDFRIKINSDQYDSITFILYIDKAGTKEFDKQVIFVIRDPAIYKLDLTNENSLVPSKDDAGNVDNEYFEESQAILYQGATMIEPTKKIINKETGVEEIVPNIIFTIVDHQGLGFAEIDMEGNISVGDWNSEWSVVNVNICAEYEGNKFYATYSITRVAGMSIYRLQPNVTAIKRHKDGTYNTELVYANVYKLETSNSGGSTRKLNSYAQEGVSVLYVYNNKILDPLKDIYTLESPEVGIPVHGDKLPETLDGEVREIDIYVVNGDGYSTAEELLAKLETPFDHETVPVVEDGDDGFNLILSNDSCTVNCFADGTQEGFLWDTRGYLMRGIEDFSGETYWSCKIEPANGLSGKPQHDELNPGSFSLAGLTMNRDVDQVSVLITARYPYTAGNEYTKSYTITKAKRGDIGESGFKSIVFCRTNLTPDKPSKDSKGGTYENPVPTHYVTAGGEIVTDDYGNRIFWTDGIPTNSKAKIWASSRLFTTLGVNETEWSEPAEMSDSESFDVEFSWYETKELMPFGNPDTEPDYWFDPVADASEFEKHSMVWMATKTISNGQPVMHIDDNGNESPWVIVRVLGEKGEATLKSMIFTRCLNQPDTPQGGNIEDPYPWPNPGEDGNKWEDGLPLGDPMHPVWMSQKTFSSLRGLETEWSVPIQMKDVPNVLDIEYTYEYDFPGNPTENPTAWFDPSLIEFDPIQQTKVWWVAQRRWETHEDGTVGWTDWDCMRVRGEDGSKAVVRMRGDWDEPKNGGDISYGEWILSGGWHMEDGKKVEEVYQDLVYRKKDNTQYCYKCLISHQKSDIYDPNNVEFVYDEACRAEKSEDGYWLKAEQYEFLSTRLLNAEQIIADTIRSNKITVPGKWSKASGNVYTQVVTENGKIEFQYSTNDRDWVTLVDIGLDPTDKFGILRFYNPSTGAAMYNLGPSGLSANAVHSPGIINTNVFWNGGFSTNIYNCFGILFDNKELNDMYSTGIPNLYLSEMPRHESLCTKGNWTTRIDNSFRVKQLDPGEYIPQMSVPFMVTNPLDYTIRDFTQGEDEGKSYVFQGYPFSGNTIGYVGFVHSNLIYEEIGFPWINGGQNAYGLLTRPIRKWICIDERLTDLCEFQSGEAEGDFNSNTGNISLSTQYNISPFEANLLASGGGSGKEKSYSIKVKDLGENNFFSIVCNNILVDINDIKSKFFYISGEGSWSSFESSKCVEIIDEAIAIVLNTINDIPNLHQCLRGTNYGDFSLSRGIQHAFAIEISSFYKRVSVLLAKRLLNTIFDHESGDIDCYVFPENQYFSVGGEHGNRYLSLTSIDESTMKGENDNLFVSTSGTYEVSVDMFKYYYNMPVEDRSYHRPYIVIDSLSGNVGSTETPSGGTGNTYEIRLKKIGTGYDFSTIEITYSAVPKFSAFLESGYYYMPNKYGSTNVGAVNDWKGNALCQIIWGGIAGM